jgi:hypothetical protein
VPEKYVVSAHQDPRIVTTRAYAGAAAFGEDRGTFAGFAGTCDSDIALGSVGDEAAKRRMRSLAGGYPIIWFVDDERANREWFRTNHRSSFATVTFSRRGYFRAALGRGLPCDAIVTDIFFPSRAVRTDRRANSLLAIYDQIAQTPVGKLPALWKKQQEKWTLDGFSIAGDGARHNPQIPVFLFSRKALLLLSVTHLRHLEILTYRCETSYAHAIWAWHQARSLVAG